MRRVALLALATLPFTGCVTLLVVDSWDKPRGSFVQVDGAWVDTDGGARRLVLQVASGEQRLSEYALGSYHSRFGGAFEVRYALDGDDGALEIEDARHVVWPDDVTETFARQPVQHPGPPPGAPRLEVLDAGPYGRSATVLLDGRPRKVLLRYGPTPADHDLLTCLAPLAVAADVALAPVYLLLAIPILYTLLVS